MDKEKFLQKILDNTPHLIFIYDLIEKRNIYINKEIGTFLGYTAEETKEIGSSLFSKILHPDDTERLREHYSRFGVVPDNTILEIEYRMKVANDGWRWLSSRDTIFSRTAEGKAKEIIGFIEDITERKIAEIMLQKNEERFRAIFESASDGMFLLDDTGKFIECNNEAVKIFGYENMNEILGHFPYGELFSPQIQENGVDSRVAAMKHINNAISGIPQKFYWKHQRKDGSVFDAEVSLNGLSFADKIYVQAIVRDLADFEIFKKQTEEQKKLSDVVIRNSPIGIITTSMSGQILTVNQSAVKILGSPSEEKTKEFNVFTLKPLVDQKISSLFSKCLTKGEEVVVEGLSYTTFWGKKTNIDLRISPLLNGKNEQIGSVVFMNDSTERFAILSRLEEANRQHEESSLVFKRIFDQSPVGMAILNLEMKFEKINDAFLKMLGYNESEILSQTFSKVTHPDENQRDVSAIKSLIAGNIEVYRVEKRYIRKDGAVVWGRVNVRIVKDINGHPIYLLPIVEDITEQKRLEELERAQTRDTEVLINLLEISEQPFVAGYMDGRLERVNKAYCELTGYSKEEIMSQGWKELTPEKWIKSEEEILNKIKEDGKPRRFEKEYIRKDGSIIPVEVFAHIIKPSTDKESAPYFAFVTNIADRKKNEIEMAKHIDIIEKLNRLMMGREEKMAEMKKEMNALEKKCGKGLKNE